MCGTLGRERAESGSLDSGANLRVESEESLPEEMANIAILWNISIEFLLISIFGQTQLSSICHHLRSVRSICSCFRSGFLRILMRLAPWMKWWGPGVTWKGWHVTGSKLLVQRPIQRPRQMSASPRSERRVYDRGDPLVPLKAGVWQVWSKPRRVIVIAVCFTLDCCQDILAPSTRMSELTGGERKYQSEP